MPPSKPYIWQHKQWPKLTFDPAVVSQHIAAARRLQGEVEGKAGAIGLDQKGEVDAEVLAQEVIATAAIEGEKLDPTAVRSSVMRHLGLGDNGPFDRHVDGLVAVIGDAGTAFQMPLDHDRLYRWQSALFPGGTRGITRIAVGRYRDHSDPMQIVSGRPGKEKVHYEAPPSARMAIEMRSFLKWFASTTPAQGKAPKMDGLARAAVAHIWFESIHPFEDGNGRIGRAISDMAIAQDQDSPLRLYSLSRQLLECRAAYYDALNQAQRGSGDVTEWVAWFVQQIGAACKRSSEVIDRAIEKSRFWASHARTDLKPRQRKVLQRLLDDGDGGFEGGLNAEKYIKMTAVSKATATRDLAEMLAEGLLWTQGQGKGLRYFINVPGWSHGVGT
ncbi:Fic family protein [Ramlibacter sp. WS9]|uniref:Fic family protein n=1 Tax=Ramlibacter sp. WS9 TaxID=1882741 RepID=UPI001142DDBA|nr:Fic family protein [Ramlibacter sp. WS9]ROZ75276.1 Fic family protein [Ramlibacter sp. WS9]